MESGETFGVCVKRKLSAISLYSNLSNVNFQEDNPIFDRLSNNVNDFDDSNHDRNTNVNDCNTKAVNDGGCDTNTGIDNVNFNNNANGDKENDATTGENNVNVIAETSSVTGSYMTAPSIFDEIMRSRGKSIRASQRYDIESLMTT